MLERWKCAVLRAEASDGRRNLAARREFNATRRALRGGATSWRGLYGQAKEAAGSARDEGARVAREGWRFAQWRVRSAQLPSASAAEARLESHVALANTLIAWMLLLETAVELAGGALELPKQATVDDVADAARDLAAARGAFASARGPDVRLPSEVEARTAARLARLDESLEARLRDAEARARAKLEKVQANASDPRGNVFLVWRRDDDGAIDHDATRASIERVAGEMFVFERTLEDAATRAEEAEGREAARQAAYEAAFTDEQPGVDGNPPLSGPTGRQWVMEVERVDARGAILAALRIDPGADGEEEEEEEEAEAEDATAGVDAVVHGDGYVAQGGRGYAEGDVLLSAPLDAEQRYDRARSVDVEEDEDGGVEELADYGVRGADPLFVPRRTVAEVNRAAREGDLSGVGTTPLARQLAGECVPVLEGVHACRVRAELGRRGVPTTPPC